MRTSADISREIYNLFLDDEDKELGDQLLEELQKECFSEGFKQAIEQGGVL